ncbi:MAG TPA: hypothetical protein DCQ28_01540 [Bacteroidetes bacterium]|nr:hypothetical protein [Bacteroidota bacterium]
MEEDYYEEVMMLKIKSIKYFLYTIVIVICSGILPAQISNDAIVLTLRIQQGIVLDSSLAIKIDSSLKIARTVNDSLASIHVFPDYVLTELLISSSAQWTKAWKTGSLLTGNSYIDSLGLYYSLTKVDTNRSFSILPLFILKFAIPLQIKTLSKLYNDYPGVNYAEPNGYAGDGNNIEYFRKNERDHFVFSHGEGDCPAGCMYRYYWYVSVTGSGIHQKALLEDAGERSFKGAKIYRWNIPDRYAMTMFPNLDSILSAVQFAPEWWVRRHAVEGLRRLWVWNYAWVGEDLKILWDTLHAQVKSRKNDVIKALQSVKNDQDADVKASAEEALKIFIPLVVEQVDQQPLDFVLFQNYPNPFNPTTQIRFQTAKPSNISLRIFNMLGQEVSILLDEYLESGVHSIDWKADQFPSGLYFYQLRADGFAESKKMVLLK